jgi:hypothetical protein
MRARLDAVGGSIDLAPVPAGGTCIVFRTPLNPNRGTASHAYAIRHHQRDRRD